MREEKMLSLKWNSFPSHFTGSLDTCYEKQQFVDLSLVCKDGSIIKCHKMVLANSSTFFRRLLVANEHPHPMIILHDVEADDLKTIINFMYCGEIQILQSEVKRLLKLAEILEVAGLQNAETSELLGEFHNTITDTSQKAPTVSRLKAEETKGLTINTTPDYNPTTTVQNKPSNQPTKFTLPAHPQKVVNKVPLESAKKWDKGNINLLSQRLDTGKSGISIIDINDMPSTSRGVTISPLPTRKEIPEPLITWPQVLSAISQDKVLPLKKLCIMDEVEITAGKSPVHSTDINKRNEPLDRRKEGNNFTNNEPMNCAVYIKDELDISEMEEDADMDPLEVEDFDNESSESIGRFMQVFPVPSTDKTYYKTITPPEYPTRKGSNG